MRLPCQRTVNVCPYFGFTDTHCFDMSILTMLFFKSPLFSSSLNMSLLPTPIAIMKPSLRSLRVSDAQSPPNIWRTMFPKVDLPLPPIPVRMYMYSLFPSSNLFMIMSCLWLRGKASGPGSKCLASSMIGFSGHHPVGSP